MSRLIVLSDASCDLCRTARRWLERQTKLVELVFIPAGSTEASRQFPELDRKQTLAELHVVDEDGAVYRGAKAWLMCLWALRGYRRWAFYFSRPGFEHRAKDFVGWVSGNRHRWSRMLVIGGRPPYVTDGCSLADSSGGRPRR